MINSRISGINKWIFQGQYSDFTIMWYRNVGTTIVNKDFYLCHRIKFRLLL